MKVSIILIAGLFSCTLLQSANTFYLSEDTNENAESSVTATDLTQYFENANLFFSKYISGGKVDYSSIQADKSELNSLVEMIATADLTDASKDTRTAFYINAYNILVIKNVTDHLPISSPLDVKGFFDAVKFTVSGESVTLNELENKKLRPDPRVHFVLVCAAKGCPKILNEAYMPDKVQAQMNAQTKKAMNDADFIRIDAANKKASVSQIFDWYKDDFLKSNASIREFINRYRTEIPAEYSIDYYTYNWQLNIK